MFDTATINGFAEATDNINGWKIRTSLKPGCGVSSLLAMREARYILTLMEAHAVKDNTSFHETVDQVRALWDGMRFRLPLVTFPNKPIVEIEALKDGRHPPSLLHSIFTSVSEE